MTFVNKRRLYLLTCAVVLVLWFAFGQFEAVEAPYVRF